MVGAKSAVTPSKQGGLVGANIFSSQAGFVSLTHRQPFIILLRYYVITLLFFDVFQLRREILIIYIITKLSQVNDYSSRCV